MKKFITISALLTVIATPAFAQSLCECNGTGNVLPFSHKSAAPQNGKITVRQNGLDSFAMVPSPGSVYNSNDPAATGGGSSGYNEMLRKY